MFGLDQKLTLRIFNFCRWPFLRTFTFQSKQGQFQNFQSLSKFLFCCKQSVKHYSFTLTDSYVNLSQPFCKANTRQIVFSFTRDQNPKSSERIYNLNLSKHNLTTSVKRKSDYLLLIKKLKYLKYYQKKERNNKN